VRDNLAAAGFASARQPGFARKRHMLTAHLCERVAAMRAAEPQRFAPARRHALVIGCGIAGAAVAERVAARGWVVTIVDGNAGPARGASALHAGAVHPHITRDDSLLSKLVRAGFLYTLASWRRLAEAGHVTGWHPCGVAHPAASDEEAAEMARRVAAFGYPPEFVEYLDAEALGRRCGHPVAHGGYWFAGAGVVRPERVIDAQLAHARAALLVDRRVERLVHADGEWHALRADGGVIASAPVAVLANSGDALRLSPAGCDLGWVRGQATYLPADAAPALGAAVVGDGYVLPAVDGVSVVGGTYDRSDLDLAPRSRDDRANLAALARLLPGASAADAHARAQAFVGLRAVARDRRPLIGAMPDVPAATACAAEVLKFPLPRFPRLPGLYGAFGFGSRGLTLAALGGEIVASLIDGEPAPVAGDLLDAVDPARFLLRAIRHSPGSAVAAGDDATR
jgi:tRNA 5-methylaminomethyl-2-thiouridine biosynthesis bifunctional protein